MLDTSALIECLTESGRAAPRLHALIDEGQRLAVCTIVLYEWWRGPRLTTELDAQERLFPTVHAIPFEAAEARIAASLYSGVPRARGRELDLAIAACAIAYDAALWTENLDDFRDLPGLRLLASSRD